MSTVLDNWDLAQDEQLKKRLESEKDNLTNLLSGIKVYSYCLMQMFTEQAANSSTLPRTQESLVNLDSAWTPGAEPEEPSLFEWEPEPLADPPSSRRESKIRAPTPNRPKPTERRITQSANSKIAQQNPVDRSPKIQQPIENPYPPWPAECCPTLDDWSSTCCPSLDDLCTTISLRHMEANGVGYPCGYTTLAVTGAPALFSPGYFFVDARTHVLNNETFAANFGNGFRFNFYEEDAVFGLNGYYDFRSTDKGHHQYNQLGCGFDFRTGRLLLSANGYFPIGNTKKLVSKHVTIHSNGLPVTRKTYINALQRFDFEEGLFFLCRENFIFYAGVGPYYLRNPSHCDSNTWGGMGHLKLNVLRFITAEFFVSHDGFFKTIFQGQLSLTFPFSTQKRRGLFPVSRQEIIPLKKFHEYEWDF